MNKRTGCLIKGILASFLLFIAVNTHAAAVYIKWQTYKAPLGATQFNIYSTCSDTKPPPWKYVGSVSIGSTTYSFNNLRVGLTRFYFTVSGPNRQNESGPIHFTTIMFSAPALSGVSVTSVISP